MKLREGIIRELKSQQDLKYHDFHGSLCPGTSNIIGVRVPVLRKIARQIAHDDWREFLEACQNEFYEETMVEGLVIATAKMGFKERLERLSKFVPKIDNWAVCDVVCASIRTSEVNQPEMWNFLQSYRNRTREFELRFMIVMMMDHFLEEEYLTQIFQTIDQINARDYYVEMAIAWLVATVFAKFRSEALAFLQENHLSDFAQNKSIQKIRESYRVSDQDKQLVLELKRPQKNRKLH